SAAPVVRASPSALVNRPSTRTRASIIARVAVPNVARTAPMAAPASETRMTGVIGSLGQSSSLRHVLDVARPPRHQLGKPWATESSIAPGAPQRSAKNRQFLPAAGTATGSPYSSPSGKTRLAEPKNRPGADPFSNRPLLPRFSRAGL